MSSDEAGRFCAWKKGALNILNSREIGRLRPDVAENCRAFIQKCAVAGYPVLVTGTVRDDEFQLDCYRKGTGGKPPATFHSVKAGLAFDVCKNVKGQEYSDAAFWAGVGKIGQQMGFTWGGSWKRVDKPHFQWDAHGKFSDGDIIAGRYPPQMPLYKEEKDMTKEETKKLFDEMLAERDAVIAGVNAKTAAWAQSAWDEAKKAGLFDGTRPGAPLTRQEAAIILQRLGLSGKGV